MKIDKTIHFEEISRSECREINAKGWVIALITAAVAYIADDWAGFKQGFADGWATLEE